MYVPIPMYSCVLRINYTNLDIRILHILMYQIDLCYTDNLRLLYPQLTNAADKSYLEMIKEIPFQYDLDNPVLELKF